MGGLRFLPWVRDGVARLISEPSPAVAGRRPARAGVALTVTAEGVDPDRPQEPVPITGSTRAVLHGPGDVTGLDRRQIIRSHPAPGAENTDVTGFAAVEFDRPDLPWLHTPGRPDPQGRLEPWLVLVVVPAGPAGRLETTDGQARLATTVGELPDLAESWAWAHAQVLVTRPDEDVATVIATAPERTLSRLVCPRRLDPDTDYLAAVVPAFDAGVAAGLGLPVPAAEIGPAWGGGPQPVDPDQPVLLPVYHHWTFRTGADGDFESLARRLRARALPPDVGRVPVDISAAGGGLPRIEPAGVPGHSVLAFEGALASPAMTPDTWRPATAAPWQARMAELLEHVQQWLTPPLYGDIHLQQGRVPPPGTEPAWLAGLNLDPRYRAAAGLGTQVVRKHQEELAAAAWERAAQLRDLDEQLRRGQAARDTATALFAKRVDPDAPGRALGDDHLVALTQPVHDLVAAPPPGLSGGPAAGSAGSLDEVFDGNAGARAATSTPFRRLLRPRGPLARRLRPAAPRADALSRLAAGATPVPPARIPTGGALFDDLVPQGQRITALTRDLLDAAAEADPWWRVAAGPGRPGAATLAGEDPPTTVTSNGGDPLGGRSYFVSTADGRLFEHRRLDGVWRWRDHGTPPGTTVVGSGAVAAGRVYVRTRDHHLYEHHFDGDRWNWVDCGNPPGGTISRPTAAGAAVYALAADATLYRFDTVARSWTGLGGPQLAAGERLWGTPRPAADGTVLVATSHQRLFRYAGQWHPVAATGQPGIWGSPASQHGDDLAYLTPGGELVTVRVTGGAFRLHGRVQPEQSSVPLRIASLAQQAATNPDSEEPEVLVLAHPDDDPGDLRLYGRTSIPDDRQPGRVIWYWDAGFGRPAAGIARHRPGPLLGDERDGEVFVRTATGGMAAYRWGDRGSGWLDHGLPNDRRGVGRVDDPAPAHTRHAPRVGLLSSLLVTYLVDAGPGSQLRSQAAHHLDEHGLLRENTLTPYAAGPSTATPVPSAALALSAPVEGGTPLLFAVAVLPGVDPDSRQLAYWVGEGVSADGAASSWAGPYPLPDPVSRHAGAVAATVVDLDGDGQRELVVAYAVTVAGSTTNRVHYRIGWGLDAAGRVSRDWSDSLPTPYTFAEIHSLGVEVVDTDGDNVPDLFLFVAGRDGAARPVARYHIGHGINRRGRIAGGRWTGPRDVADAPAVAAGPGAGIAVADLTGTRRPDLVLAWRTTAGQLVTRVAFDLDAAGVPVRWSPPRVTPGLADPTTGRGCCLLVGDLRGDLVDDRAVMGDNFLRAAGNHQDWLVPAQELAHDPAPEPVSLGRAAQAARATVLPETAVAGEVLAGLTVGGRPLAAELPESGDALRGLLAGVTFDVPSYELLRGLSQEHIAPNLPSVAPETMTALAVNPRFVEAFLVGLNHEMSREMLWRGFPADPRQTWFRQFWDTRGARSAGQPLTDLPPLTDQAWRSGPLGSHLTAVGAPGEQSLVLVIRGEVLRRFPSTVVTMRAAEWVGAVRQPTGADLPPIFNGWLAPDLLLFGFPLTAAQARGSADPADGRPGHFFVLREQPTAARFGLDLPPQQWPPQEEPPAWPPAHWDDLHWGHLPAGALFLSPDAPGMPTEPVDGAVFGRTAADMARVALQKPVMLARHASDLLPTPETQP